MKAFIASLAIALAPVLAVAQTAAPKPVAKPAAKKSSKLAPAAQKAVEELTPIDGDPDITLSEADLEVARKIYVGTIPCELGAAVTVTPARRAGFFSVVTRGHRYVMHPVESRTGAIRLEDPKGGAMWLQLGNKSMLMSQKLGQRLADECQSPEQVTAADVLKKSPPRDLLDPVDVPGPKASAPSPTGPN